MSRATEVRGGLRGTHLRAGHPDFLDLPWHLPLDEWDGHTDRLERLPMGLARHPVRFVAYDGRAYALKALPPGRAQSEFDLLRLMEDRRLQAVTPVGHLDVTTREGEGSVLITRYLDWSLPYHVLFSRGDLSRYRSSVLDALAGLLVQLHLSGVYWGDCSMFNTLFVRDDGALQAYLVDAETAVVHAALPDAMREHDLEVMEENVAGAFADLAAIGLAPLERDWSEIASSVRHRYDGLWREVNQELVIARDERWRIEQRVRALNELGFSVSEMELSATDAGERLELRVTVTDRSFHRDLLHSLTGLEVQEQQAQKLLNEVHQLRAALSEDAGRSVSLLAAAHEWTRERYEPLTLALAQKDDDEDPAQLYCELLEHKWLLSEREQADVGHERALADYLTVST